MGNCSSDEEFFVHFGHLIKEMYRTLAPGPFDGRALHEYAKQQAESWYIGLRDFRGDLIRSFSRRRVLFITLKSASGKIQS